MDFYLVFEIIIHLLVGVGVWAAFLNSTISATLPFIVGILAAISLGLRFSGRKPSMPGILKLLLSMGLITAFGFDSLFLSTTLLESSSRFLTVLLGLKLFDLKANRDYFQIIGIAFFLLLAASSSFSGIAFLPLFLSFTILLIWTLILFHLKHTGEEVSGTYVHRKEKKVPKGIVTPLFFPATAIVSLIAFFITASIFFAIPRIGIGFFDRGITEQVRVSGFSEEVNLGDIGKIKLDPAVVLRVEFPDLPGPPKRLPYWRGKAYDHFDGFKWDQTDKTKKFVKKEAAGRFIIRDFVGKKDVLKHRVLLEPINSNVLFTASQGAAVSGRFPYLKTDPMDAIYFHSIPYRRREYTAYSLPRSESTLTSRGKKIFLQLPLLDEKLKTLAEFITRGHEQG